jgi:hypothetical protein
MRRAPGGGGGSRRAEQGRERHADQSFAEGHSHRFAFASLART